MNICDEIKNILQQKDLETNRVELKKSDILKTKDGKKKFLHEVVAFANRFGGRIFIGIMNDGTFEGKDIFDIDKDKGIITSIIHDKISPQINCGVDFISCKDGDIIVVEVPKRKDIPHAYVNKTTGGEIIHREYLIRTPHGVNHVSDRQLQYLFKEQDINFNYPFSIGINFIRDELKLPFEPRMPEATELIYSEFFNELPEEDTKLLLSGSFENAIFHLTPYMLLKSFSYHFSNSWNIKINRGGLITGNLKSPIKKITIDDLPDVPEDSILNSLSMGFKNYLKEHTFNDLLVVPPNTDIEIDFKDGLGTSLIFKNNDFNFKISFFRMTGGMGMERAHPQLEAVLDDNISDIEKNDKDYFHMRATGIFSASFNLPETNFDLFDDYYQYALTIKKILQKKWDYSKHLKKFPHRIHYSMNKKLKRIIDFLMDKNSME